jgi:hypothetical protein
VVLEELNPSYGSVVRDMNAHGWVAGQIPGGGPPIVWAPDGAARYLDTPFGDHNVRAINADGDVVGDGTLNATGRRVSWLYTAQEELARLRPVTPGRTAYVAEINRDRVSVGQQDGMPVMWSDPDERARWLPTPDGTTSGEAKAVGARGGVQGIITKAEGTYRALWSPTGELRGVTLLPEGFRPGRMAGPYVAGTVGIWPNTSPAIVSSDGMVTIDLPDDAVGAQHSAITRSGYLAGGVTFTDGHREAFIASPSGETMLFDDSSWALAITDGDRVSAAFSGVDGDDPATRRTCLTTLVS